MAKNIQKVGLVIDLSFEPARLEEVVSEMHVWVLETPGNLTSIEQLGSQLTNESSGITIFPMDTGEPAPEEALQYILETIEIHHRESDDDEIELHVFGIREVEEITKALSDSGFSGYKKIADNYYILSEQTD